VKKPFGQSSKNAKKPFEQFRGGLKYIKTYVIVPLPASELELDIKKEGFFDRHP